MRTRTAPTETATRATVESESFRGDQMKKIIIRIIAAVMLMTMVVSMAACGSKNIYDTYAKDGYTVRGRYDSGGAFVNDTQDVTIVEVFSENDVTTVNGKTGISLLAPDDSLRGEGVFKLAKIDGQNNYYQVGWYTKRTPRVDSNGNPLDAYGVPTSESGREQAYVYEGKWDFKNDVVEIGSLVDGEMTLYAAWIPFFTYEFYAKNEAGEYELIGSKQKLTLVIPEWKTDRKGQLKLDMNDFPKVNGKVFESAYLDEAMTEELTADINGRESFVNTQNGTASCSVVKIYLNYVVEEAAE